MGTFLATQAFLPTRNQNATIVATSTAGIVFSGPMGAGNSAYLASKVAVNKFIEILAADQPDVHVVSVHPGVIKTDMLTKSGLEEALPHDDGE